MYSGTITCNNCHRIINSKQTIFRAFDFTFCSSYCKNYKTYIIMQYDPNFTNPRSWQYYININELNTPSIKKSKSHSILIDKPINPIYYKKNLKTDYTYPKTISYQILHAISTMINLYSYSKRISNQFMF
jgi:hypothetical protein